MSCAFAKFLTHTGAKEFHFLIALFFVLFVAALLGICISSSLAVLCSIPFEEITRIISAFVEFVADRGAKVFHLLVFFSCVLFVAAPIGKFISSPIVVPCSISLEEIIGVVFAFAKGCGEADEME